MQAELSFACFSTLGELNESYHHTIVIRGETGAWQSKLRSTPLQSKKNKIFFQIQLISVHPSTESCVPDDFRPRHHHDGHGS